jgi:thiosulfate/3-mercaptopyruvate sulfurtransferase
MLNFFKIPKGLLVLVLLASAGCSESGQEKLPGILVSADWLEEEKNDPDLVILHSGTAELYDSIHIPGARLILPSEFMVAAGALRNEIPAADTLVEILRDLGVNRDSRIVLYPENQRYLTRTARVYLTLDHLGLGEQSFVLNGGLSSWQEEGRALTAEKPVIREGNLETGDLKEVLIKSAALDTLRWSNKIVLIDARSDGEYRGIRGSGEDLSEGGHIEGAYFLPYQDLLLDDESAKFKSAPELLELFKKAGMDPEKTTVVYCGSGVRASASYLAARHMGFPALLYDGSYEEWRDLGLPMTGPVPLPDKIE